MKKKTHEEFIEELKIENMEVFKNIEFLEKYRRSGEKIKARDKYGEIYVKPNSLLSGSIPSIKSALNKTEYFKNILKEVNPKAYEEFEFIENYKGNKKKIKAIGKYGEVLVRPHDLLQGKFPTIQLAIDKDKYFANQGIEVHKNKYGYENIIYVNTYTKIEIYCNDCKEYFWQTPDSHLQGRGCSRCVKYEGEERVKEYLLKNNIKFKSQKTFKGCKYKNKLSFDFYLIDHNTCVEFDGIQHFKPTTFNGVSTKDAKEKLKKQKIKDKIKDKYCEDNGIRLIRIPYTEFKNIDKILKNKIAKEN